MDTLRAMSLADSPKGKQLTDAQYEPLLDALAEPYRRRLLRSRLRRQAWVLDRAGATRERDLVLAVSASLRSMSITDMVGHPFLRSMADLSVQLADPVGMGGLGTIGGMNSADLFGGGLTGLPGLSDAWLENFGELEDIDD